MSGLLDSLRTFLLWLSGQSSEVDSNDDDPLPEDGSEVEAHPEPDKPDALEYSPPSTAESASSSEVSDRDRSQTDLAESVEDSITIALSAGASIQEVATVPDDDINDAKAYGVEIVPVDISPGTAYWRVIRVHHLTPEENHGNHHIYLDALDDDGNRVYGAQALITWDGGQQTVTIDKPLSEPGTNFPMWKWQVCTVEMLGMASDRVTNLHTAHPDEPPGTGNTLFHHSFQIDYQRSVKGSQGPGEPGPQASVISGTVSNGQGSTVLLLQDDAAVDSTVLDESEAFRFQNLAAGTYVVAVADTEVRSQPIVLDGTNTVTVDLALPAEPGDGKLLERYMLFGDPSSARTAVYLALAEDHLANLRFTFGYRLEDALHAQEVILLGSLGDIDQAAEDALMSAGCQVQRIQGSAEEIAAALEALT